MHATIKDPQGEKLPLLQALAGLSSPKDGRGIGELADAATVDAWVAEFLAGRSDGKGEAIAFRFGVSVESRFAGQSFGEAEAVISCQWSLARGWLRWERGRDAGGAGCDGAWNRRAYAPSGAAAARGWVTRAG